MASKTIIRQTKATEVIVPAKPGSLKSDTVLDKDSAFAKKFKTKSYQQLIMVSQ